MAERSRILALLVALAALAVPLGGAAVYAGFADTADDGLSVPVSALGVASDSDVLGPTLLVGALALGVLATRQARQRRGAGLLCLVVVAAALVQAAGFSAFVFELLRPESGFFAPDGSYQVAKWSTAARMAMQVLVCIVVVVFAGRLFAQKEKGIADV